MLLTNSLKVVALHFIIKNFSTMAKSACLTLCVGLGLSASVSAAARVGVFLHTEDKPRRVAENEQGMSDVGLQQTLKLNFAPERRDDLRKALEDYARSVDPSHEQIEERRREMQKSIESRFLDADNDNDGTLDRQEATEKLPQIARHFSSVDTNQDNVISLDELEEAQARILERRRAAEAMRKIRQQQNQTDAEVLAGGKAKAKTMLNSYKKHEL